MWINFPPCYVFTFFWWKIPSTAFWVSIHAKLPLKRKDSVLHLKIFRVFQTKRLKFVFVL